MPPRTTLAFIVLTFAAVASLFVYVRSENVASSAIGTVPVAVSEATATPITRTDIVSAAVTAVTATTTHATFIVAEKEYTITVTQDKTVLDAMRALSAAGTFTFTGREYPGLGFFVDSIDGKKNAGGKYWVYYVNGVSATSGVSSQLVRTGDRIEWKYEKSY